MGDQAIGKTRTITTYTKGKHDIYQTSGGDYLDTWIAIGDNKQVSVDIYDTESRERYLNPETFLQRRLYPRLDLIVIMYDIANQASFRGVKDRWHPLIKAKFPQVRIMLVGSSPSLSETRMVSEEEAKSFAQRNGFSYTEVNPASSENIGNFFKKIGKEIADNLSCILQPGSVQPPTTSTSSQELAK